MQPLTIITGIILGSAASISLGLTVVALIFLVLADEYPRLAAEFRPLLGALALFIAMTAVAAASFYGLIRNAWWRWPIQFALWADLVFTGWFYWPR